ncbi:MAG: NUDIX hydrolase [Thermoflexales bacterium]|nr:NUDIX hydrolase [Thermoflexales bacterium]
MTNQPSAGWVEGLWPEDLPAWRVCAYAYTETDQLLVDGRGAQPALIETAGAPGETPTDALRRAVAAASGEKVERCVALGADYAQTPPRLFFWARTSSGSPTARALDAAALTAHGLAHAQAFARAGAINAKFRPLGEFMARLPRKRMAAGVLCRNAAGQILIVKPGYRPDWLVPGGVTEADESPRMGAAREALEEVGLVIAVGRLLAMEYIPARPPRTESLQFIFDGGVLDEARIATIVPQQEELTAVRFADPAVAIRLLGASLGGRVAHALDVLAGRRDDVYRESPDEDV